MATPLVVVVAALLAASLPFETLASSSSQRFDTHNFTGGSGSEEVAFHSDGGAVSFSDAEGRTVYGKLIRFPGAKHGFSTNFSFSVSGGSDLVSLDFLLVPSSARPLMESKDGIENLDWLEMSVFSVRYAGGENSTSQMMSSVGVFMDIPGGVPIKSRDLSIVDLNISSGQKLQSWIDYDGESEKLEVRLIRFGYPKLSGYSMYCYVDLSSILRREEMLAGFRLWSKNATRTSNIYSWSFGPYQGAPYRMHSEPLDPNSLPLKQPVEVRKEHIQRAYPWRLLLAVVFGAACGVLMMYAALLLWSAMFDRRPVAPMEYPEIPRHSIAPMEYPEKPLENGHEKVVMVADKVGVDKAAK